MTNPVGLRNQRIPNPGPITEPGTDAVSVEDTCPRWCVTVHGSHLGEEDWLHTSRPVLVADGLEARVCTSRNADTGEQDGPLVLIGSRELTPDETHALGESLMRLARIDEDRVPPEPRRQVAPMRAEDSSPASSS